MKEFQQPCNANEASLLPERGEGGGGGGGGNRYDHRSF